MYNADPRSQEFMDGVHSLLRAAEANKRDGFMCCPCAVCMDENGTDIYSTVRSTEQI